jgi:acetyl-CoA acetyltransferase
MQREGVCIVGYGETKYSREKRPVIMYMADAIKMALDNAKLKKGDVGGLAVTSMSLLDYPSWVAEQLGLELDWVQEIDCGGAAGVVGVRRAADAIQLGEIDVAVCVAGDSIGAAGMPVRMRNYIYDNYMGVNGWGGPNSLFALTQRLHMAEYGTTREQLGKIAVSQRKNAELNENAFFRSPLTIEDYLNSRVIADPICLYDCVRVVSGAAAVVVASERKAKKLTEHQIYLVTDCEKSNYQVTNMAPDRLELGYKAFAKELFSKVSHREIDFAEIYDDYPIAVLMQLENLGFCPKGKGGEFIESHDLTISGDFPLNTGGGQLSVGQADLAGAYLPVVEAVRQLKGEAGSHQVKGAKTGLVTGLGLFGYHIPLACAAAMILQRR